MKTTSVPKIVLAIGLAGGIIAASGCSSAGNGATPATQLAKVIRGDITTEIVAGGNLELSQKEDLAFQVAGTVSEVLVQQEDAVEKGQVIARLDTATLEDNLKTAERAVKTAELDLSEAEGNTFQIKTAEYDLEKKTQDFNKLNYPYTYSTFTLDVPYAIELLIKAQSQMEEAQKELEKDPQSGEALSKYRNAQLNVSDALERLRRGQSIDVYSSTKISEIVTDYQAARSALLAMETSQYNLEKTKRNVQNAIDKAKIALDKAVDDYENAKEDLANAVIMAPFAGFITKVGVSGGDEIQKGTVAAQLADPARFKTTIMVGESEVFKLSENMSATIQIDSLPSITLQARVTQIAPTATIQSGVVNYEVEVEADAVQNATTVFESRLPTGPASNGTTELPAGQPSGQSGQSFGSGERIFPARTGEPSLSGGGRLSAAQSAGNTQLREGLSITLNITVSGKKNILMVPGQAVMRSGKDVQAQVMKNGVTETRVINTGISNWQYTEVLEGLEEGEEVLVQTVIATSTTGQRNQQGGNFMVPGGAIPGGNVVIGGGARR